VLKWFIFKDMESANRRRIQNLWNAKKIRTEEPTGNVDKLVQVRHLCFDKFLPPYLVEWALVYMPNGAHESNYMFSDMSAFYENVAKVFVKDAKNFSMYYYDGMTTYKINRDGTISLATGKSKAMHLTPYYVSDMIYRSNRKYKSSSDGLESAHFFFKDT